MSVSDPPESAIHDTPAPTSTTDNADVVDSPVEDASGSALKNNSPSLTPSFPIVGVGTSAGGLEALEALFRGMPAKCDLAFVVVAHLDPTHTSLLPELLQKRSEMQILNAKDGVSIQPNRVYVIPANTHLTVRGDTLRLSSPRGERRQEMLIDAFFSSLAADRGPRAICVVLSGTGTDGTAGVKAIKAAGGVAMVQSPTSAKYDGMPRSAISTGHIDYESPPDEIAVALLDLGRRWSMMGETLLYERSTISPAMLTQVNALLLDRTQHDFSQYKTNTICRRILRRMNVHQIEQIADYVRYLEESPNEATILFQELLIGVTRFYRDPAAFEALETDALPALLADRPDDHVVRAWVPGCSGGEEAYTVAISLRECIARRGGRQSVQVFGTDIDERSIESARLGVYASSIETDVQATRLSRHFHREEDGRYRVKKSIRDLLVFAPQDIVRDPPFTKLDLLCCRNLLIYFGTGLQHRLLPMFHYSLNPDGILFLGSSETIGHRTDLFDVMSKKWKIYRKRPASVASRPLLKLSMATPITPARVDSPHLVSPKIDDRTELQLVETLLRHAGTPPCAVVDEACDVVYIHGHCGQFLEPAQGRVSVNILSMARPGLRSPLSAGIRKAQLIRQTVRRKGLRLEAPGAGEIEVSLTIVPVLEPASVRSLLVIIFQTLSVSQPGDSVAAQPVATPDSERSAEELEAELVHMRESLQTTIEELEGPWSSFGPSGGIARVVQPGPVVRSRGRL